MTPSKLEWQLYRAILEARAETQILLKRLDILAEDLHPEDYYDLGEIPRGTNGQVRVGHGHSD